jgi:hypothetical protein
VAGDARYEDRSGLLELMPKQAVCAEIGVWAGDFTEQILQVTEPRRLHLIDPWRHEEGDAYEHAWYGGRVRGQVIVDRRYDRVLDRFEPEIRAGRVTIHRGYSGDVLNEFDDGYFDWVYIDGNHLYEFVMRDLELSFRKTKAGGYIAGDDYGEGGWWQGGVKKAVDEFVQRAAVESIATDTDQFLLRKTSGDQPD